MKPCYAVFLGRVEYRAALELQSRIERLKKQGFAPDVLLLLEHPPTITLGRNADRKHLLATEEQLRSRGVELYEVDRGGDITFHGPGQLVGYPLLQLDADERDVHRYMRNLEESLIRLLEPYGIAAGRNPKYTGVWTGQGKIAAMGVHISRWVTRHGFALNVNTDLSYFDLMVPCGIAGAGVVSMQSLLAARQELSDVAGRYLEPFSGVFRRELERVDPDRLEGILRGYEADSAGA